MTMNSTFPIDKNNNTLSLGDYVKYNDEIWEIINYEESEHPLTDDNYSYNATLLLSPRSFDGENLWVEDYDVLQTNHQQLCFNYD